MKYKVGDKVVILGYRTEGMDKEGKMDEWLGQTMTIAYVEDSCYLMAESTAGRNAFATVYWGWSDEMIDHEKTAKLKRNEMRYKKGDKVVIVTERTKGMNTEGQMDHWLGKTMTVREPLHISNQYKMVEDSSEHSYGDGWVWNDKMIDHLATERLQDIYKNTKISFEEEDIKRSMENMLGKPKSQKGDETAQADNPLNRIIKILPDLSNEDLQNLFDFCFVLLEERC